LIEQIETPATIFATAGFEQLGVVYGIAMTKLKGRDGYTLNLAYTVGRGPKTELAAEVGDPFTFLRAIGRAAPTVADLADHHPQNHSW
jgi:hypothetical protein